MTTRFRVADRVRATRRNRGWLGTSGGTVVGLIAATDITGQALMVAWDHGMTNEVWAVDVQPILRER